MHIQVPYLQKRSKTSWRYRRRVPADLKTFVGKSEIVIPLGRTEHEAVSAYAAAHSYAESLLSDKPLPIPPDIQRLIPRPPLAAQPDTTRDIQLGPTLEAARKLYLKDRIGDDRKKQLELARIFKLVTDIVPSGSPMSHLTRETARDVRDHMQDGRSAATVLRYLNVVRALVNHAIREFDLQTQRNPFLGLEVRDKTSAEPDRDKRHPFSETQVRVVRDRVLANGSDELGSIWVLLENSGCRISEITGLRKSDVRLHAEIPHFIVQWHDKRRLKTKASQRCIPLHGVSLPVIQQALKIARGDMLFPTYGRPGGGDAASAALGKHVRACIDDRKITTHSLRHRMKDLTRRAGTPKAEQDILLGHSSSSVGENYGGSEARLVVAKRVLEAALAMAQKLQTSSLKDMSTTPSTAQTNPQSQKGQVR